MMIDKLTLYERDLVGKFDEEDPFKALKELSKYVLAVSNSIIIDFNDGTQFIIKDRNGRTGWVNKEETGSYEKI